MFGHTAQLRKVRWPKPTGRRTFSRAPLSGLPSPRPQDRRMRRSPGFSLSGRVPFGLAALGLAAAALAVSASSLTAQVRVTSPDGRNEVVLELSDGKLTYAMLRDRRPLILPSALGFEFRGAPTLRDGLRLADITRRSHDEWW